MMREEGKNKKASTKDPLQFVDDACFLQKSNF